ncbi:radical SAM family heme chaperone HemW [Floccifex sp.]|uniref:radical SAM family heme chaperone HemW n=1 Tax=Floccifex sp. TaxID=2815810 RepID=UPI003F01753F
MHAYVHIPFCDSICFYCDFCRKIDQNKDIYLDALEREIHSLSFPSLDTLYFGGGTPSCLSTEQINRLCHMFSPYLKTNYEWTMECNPDSITEEKIKMMKECGINRISLGVQTFHDSLLKQIGRKHNVKDVYHCISLLRKYGFSNISIDLIYGLPNQSLQQVKEDLDCFLNLHLPHLSIYSLQIEENSIFGKQKLQPIDSDIEEQMYEIICESLKDYQHYEISSFCLDNQFSRHNLSYWKDLDFIGIGYGACGKENNIRYSHVSNYQDYLKQPNQRIYDYTSLEDQKFEAIMMSLRTSFGLDVKTFNEKYQSDFYKEYQDILLKYKDYFLIHENTCSCTQKGRDILNTILIDFLD